MNLMPMQNNKLIAQLWMDFINKKDIEGICAVTSDTWKMHGALPDMPEGPEGVRKLFNSFGPVQQKWIIRDIISEADKVVIRAVNYCRQDSFLGISTNGRLQVFTAMFIHHIKDGRIQETWRNADDLGRLMQVGGRIVQELQEAV
jgi:predicted SnoaL-like aldol condensation-catalyzing enzyme